MVVTLAASLYSVYGLRRQESLSVGEPSPQTYQAPIDIQVTDQLATERERQVARSQVQTIYTSDQQVQRLVINAITSAGLPAEVQDLIVSAYNNPQGVLESSLPQLIEDALALTPQDRQREVRLLLDRRLIPSSVPNAQLTTAAKDAAAAAVKPVMQSLQAGQIIVLEGETLTTDQLTVLEATGLYNARVEAAFQQLIIIFGCLLLAALLSLPLLYAKRQLAHQLTFQQLTFLVLLTLAVVVLQRVSFLLDTRFLFTMLAPLLVAVLVSEFSAIIWSIWISIVIMLFIPSASVITLLTSLAGGIVASLLAMTIKTRTSLLVAGSAGGVAAALSYALYLLIIGGFSTIGTLTSLLFIVTGGILAGILALGLLPLAESNFGFLTEFRLLELSSPTSPLLQKLLLEAPGTYQHSLIISNLVEQAVKNIGGNALLARVGALYHDVGKLKRAHFFVENQFSGENPHDKLSPHLSFLIITSHVRDGVDLLREYKLPKALEPFVMEHHGTTVLTYFYKRALEDSSKLDELNFRYPGPRPRSIESTVLSIADAVESASRTLTDPTQSSIRALIDRIIETRLQDDQFAESPIHYRDLEVIASTFERMLTAILHRRINYPSAEEIQGLKRGGDSRRNPAVPGA